MLDRDCKANCDILSKKLIDRRFKKAEIYDSKSKTFDRNRGDLLTQNDETIIVFSKRERGRNKHWNILQITNEFKDVFPEPPAMCFGRSKNLDENNSQQ